MIRQKAKILISALDEMLEEAIIQKSLCDPETESKNMEVIDRNIKRIHEAQKTIENLLEIEREKSNEIELLRETNNMYETFLKFHKGLNFFAFLVAIAAFILSCTAFWSSIMK